VLILEENDIQCTNDKVVADALLEVEKTMSDLPDEVYLVTTAVRNLWYSLPLRVDNRNYYELSGDFEDITEVDPDTLIDLTGR
jgi:hypothetical protein